MAEAQEDGWAGPGQRRPVGDVCRTQAGPAGWLTALFSPALHKSEERCQALTPGDDQPHSQGRPCRTTANAANSTRLSSGLRLRPGSWRTCTQAALPGDTSQEYLHSLPRELSTPVPPARVGRVGSGGLPQRPDQPPRALPPALWASREWGAGPQRPWGSVRLR